MSNPNLAKRIGEASRTCSCCRQEFPLTAQYFRVRADRPSGYGYTCKRCIAGEDKRRDRKEGAPRKSRHCFACSGLKHRRPRHGLCACGERYEAEPAKTIEEAMAAPRDYSRMTAI